MTGPLGRSAAVALLTFAGAFVVLIGASMACYPGGSWLDRHTSGHAFWGNFFCDLTQPVALNGAPNTLGSWLAQAAMLTLAAAFVPFWRLLPTLFQGDRRLGAAVRVFGLVSALGLVLVPLTPSTRLGALHGIAVFAASIPGILAAVLGAIGLSRARSRLCLIAAGTLLISAVDAALYMDSLLTGAPPSIALPVLQKLAAIGLIGWMATVGAAVLRPS